MSGVDLRQTVAVSLWAGQQRGDAPNRSTLIVQVPRVAVAMDPRSLFTFAYPRFMQACRSVDEPGLAIIAIDETTGQAAGICRVLARVGRPVGAIIGRHDQCDLFLSGRDELALRHLAVVVEPVTNWQRGATQIRYRVMDLRTHAGMIGEDGKRLRGLVCEGPAIIRCGGYTMYMLPLGDPSDWPDDGKDAWEMLPARVFLDEVMAEGSSVVKLEAKPMRVGGLAESANLRQTIITRTHGPQDSGSMLVQNGDTVGVIELSTPHRQLRMNVGERALQTGVLFGRYDRCDAMGAAADDGTLSRVHILLVKVEDRVMVIDTASSNGTFQNGERIRFAVFEGDGEVRLGKRTFLRWRDQSPS
ncbi:MAG TPA: FHA domain-containing protein [Kofleriaceae bacterium]